MRGSARGLLHDAAQTGREGRGIGRQLAVHDAGLVVQQPSRVLDDGPIASPAKRAASAVTSGWLGLISRTGFVCAPSLPCCARIFSRRRSGPNSGAIRQAGLSDSRSDARTSSTASSSVCFMKASRVATAGPTSLASGASEPSAIGTDLMSAAPWVTDLKGLPSKPAEFDTQKASTGSGSSRTSMPRALKPSSCGLACRRLMSSPRR